MQVSRAGKLVPMTAHEFKLLRFFLDNAERVLTREELLNDVWGYNFYPSTRTVDNQILKLRQKLEADPANPDAFSDCSWPGIQVRLFAGRLKLPGKDGGGETGGDADAYDPAPVSPRRLLWINCAQFDRDSHQPAEANSPGARVGSSPLHRHLPKPANAAPGNAGREAACSRILPSLKALMTVLLRPGREPNAPFAMEALSSGG
jgi:hypothetical protein